MPSSPSSRHHYLSLPCSPKWRRRFSSVSKTLGRAYFLKDITMRRPTRSGHRLSCGSVINMSNCIVTTHETTLMLAEVCRTQR